MGMKHLIEASLGGAYGSFLEQEGVKGCFEFNYDYPVSLEPPYAKFALSDFLAPPHRQRNPRKYVRKSKLSFASIWFDLDWAFEWKFCEDYVKSFVSLQEPFSFEIFGNSREISFQVCLGINDIQFLIDTTKARFPQANLEQGKDILEEAGRDFVAREYFALPPYSGVLTNFQSFITSALVHLISSLSSLKGGVGGYQILFIPVHNDWHTNISNLIAGQRIHSNMNFSSWSGYNNFVSDKVLSDSLNFKADKTMPIFAAVLRTFSSEEGYIDSVSSFLNTMSFGGRPLQYVSEKDNVNLVGSILSRESYHHGMLLNSCELTGLFHIPPPDALVRFSKLLKIVDTLPIPKSLTTNGVNLGTATHLGKTQKIRIPDNLRDKHIYVVGKTGMGKSTLQTNLFLQDIENGDGACFIDPHGLQAEKLVSSIPKNRIDDTIYFTVTHPNQFPCFNPFATDDEEVGNLANDYVSAFRNIVRTWGDRMENTLRNTFYTLLRGENLSLSDVSKLLSNTREAQDIRKAALKRIRNPIVADFWQNQFPKYSQKDLDPVSNKLGKLMLNEKVARIFSQKENKINLQEIIDNQKILIINLSVSTLGDETTNLLGSFLISIFHKELLRRKNKEKPFYLYVDEFHRFSKSSIDKMMEEARQYNCGLILAHQQKGQLTENTKRAIGNASTLILFSIDATEATHLIKEFPRKINIENIQKLKVGDAYTKIGAETIKLHTYPPRETISSSKEEVIQKSQKYYSEIDNRSESIKLRSREYETFGADNTKYQ